MGAKGGQNLVETGQKWLERLNSAKKGQEHQRMATKPINVQLIADLGTPLLSSGNPLTNIGCFTSLSPHRRRRTSIYGSTTNCSREAQVPRKSHTPDKEVTTRFLWHRSTNVCTICLKSNLTNPTFFDLAVSAWVCFGLQCKHLKTLCISVLLSGICQVLCGFVGFAHWRRAHRHII